MEKLNGTKLSHGLSYAAAGMMMLLPFHAFLTVWVASLIGQYTLLRGWKEIVLLGIMLPAWYILWHNKSIRSAVVHSRLVRIILIFIALQVVIGLVALVAGGVNAEALALGVISNCRYLIFFMVMMVVSRECSWLYWHWRTVLFAPAIAVVLFGLLQFFVLPADFLTRFGYGPDTIPAVSTIDHKEAYVRIQSTLRGPNPLGAYLVLIISALIALALKHKHYREWRIASAVAASAVLFLSASRSAWLGCLVAVAFIVWLWLQRKGANMKLWSSVFVAVILAALIGVVGMRNNDFVQNYFFHTDETSLSEESSNAERGRALMRGTRDVAMHPLGQGVGTAGPASVHNDRPSRIAENYFLQIGQETGWMGLGLFLLILAGVARHLWITRDQTISVMLLGSLIGLSVVNLLSHSWADDTISYLWWGLAGVAVASSVFGDRKNELLREAKQQAR